MLHFGRVVWFGGVSGREQGVDEKASWRGLEVWVGIAGQFFDDDSHAGWRTAGLLGRGQARFGIIRLLEVNTPLFKVLTSAFEQV